MQLPCGRTAEMVKNVTVFTRQRCRVKRALVLPVCCGSALGQPSGRACLKHLPREVPTCRNNLNWLHPCGEAVTLFQAPHGRLDFSPYAWGEPSFPEKEIHFNLVSATLFFLSLPKGHEVRGRR